MSEDKQNNENLNDDPNANEVEQLKREKAAMEMKLRRSEEQLYDEDYLNYLQEKDKKKAPQNSLFSGGRLSDYSEEEMQNLPVSKLAAGIASEVYNQLKSDENTKMTKEQARLRKEQVAATRVEIKNFAKDHPDFWNRVDEIDRLSDKNPNLNTEQLYVLAGGKLEKEPPTKKEEKPKPPPNTRATAEAGMKQTDKNLSRREIIQQEYQKLK